MCPESGPLRQPLHDPSERLSAPPANPVPITTHRRFIPGVIRAHWIVCELQRFQDLVRHHQGDVHQIEMARPLPKLIREVRHHPEREEALIAREINRLIPQVDFALRKLPISTRIFVRSTDRSYDLVNDYFQLPSTLDGDRFEMLIQALDRGIGAYRARRQRAALELLSPVHWLAWFVRLPMRVLELAGFSGADSMVGRAYELVLKAGMILLIGAAATKLGLEVPWDKLLGR